MDLFARAVEAVRAEARRDRLVLVGHSMGTPVIRQYARLYPQRVAALVLVDGVVVLGAPPRPGVQRAQPPVADRMRGPDGPKNARGDDPRHVHAGHAEAAAGPRAEDDAGGARGHRLRRDGGDLRSRRSGANDVMTMPVLGLFADKSALGNPDATRKLLPNYEHHEIPGTGHFLMMEKPREFNALLTAFVDIASRSADAAPRQRGDAADAAAALDGGADFIDAKDPAARRAGRRHPRRVQRDRRARVGGRRPVTAALGDACIAAIRRNGCADVRGARRRRS